MTTNKTTWQGVFASQVQRLGQKPALMTKESGRWEEISWIELDNRVRAFGRALLAHDFEKGQVVSILASNRWQWGVSDLGAMHVGGIATGIYPTNSAEQCEYILNHSETRFVFCDTKERVERILQVAPNLPLLKKIIALDNSVQHEKVITWADWIASGEKNCDALNKRLDKIIGEAKPDDVVMYVYTSGTTGPPKCVQLRHSNLIPGLTEAQAFFDQRDGDTGISYLPPAHVADRVGSFYLNIFHGGTVAYVEKVEEMIPAMTEVRPHVMVWVPRIYEKVYTKIRAGVDASPPMKQKIFNWALEVGRKSAPYRIKLQPIPFPLSLQFALAKKMVYDKLNAKLLGGRLRFFLSGAAPLSKEVAEFFFNLNIPIYETWSMSETSALATVNRPGHTKYGSVGQPLPMVSIKIAEDGEILIKGVNVMSSYYKNDEANKEAFTKDGYLCTGDIGRFDEDGFLYITDRKKDLIITSSGKNIAPQNIETLLKQNRYISMALAHGNNRNFVTALITLDKEEVAGWAKEKGLALNPDTMHENAEVKKLIGQAVEETNGRLSRIEQVKKFHILPRDFQVDQGEITPTLKLKRKEVEKKYKSLLDGFYTE